MGTTTYPTWETTMPLPVHPRTGLAALGVTSRGPVWPVLGGDGTNDADADDKGDKTTGESKTGDADKDYPANTPVADMTPEQQIAYWRHQARKHESRVKHQADYDALKDKASKFDELTEAQKSELERAQGEAERFKAENAKLAAQVLRRDVAEAKGLPKGWAPRLVGETQAELEADADKLLADVRPGNHPDPDQGNRSKGPKKATVASGRDLYAQRHTKTTTL